MAKYNRMYCVHCRDYVMVKQDSANHVLHAVLSLMTCGLWLIIWALSCVRFGGWRCTRCGSANVVKCAPNQR